ncbi:hypothetical protein [Ensifer sp. Root558]|uniref:hypothetical protein n=1 Tax=Ensifer sp. Root558 TaxID=1736558 RepID=UPI000712407B|nr:hypothetical protein [Ensifer sp. Root558]KQZ41813.1 hypothetical protein ASD63_16570 [Ensifer sp. Root558]
MSFKPRRVKLHELYREVEALGGASHTSEDEVYNRAVDDVLSILRASGFGEGFYIDQREYENRGRLAAREFAPTIGASL